MKVPVNYLSGLAVCALLSGCNNGSPDSVKNAKEANTEKIDSQKVVQRSADSTAAPSKADADFLVNAASGAMMEVELGQLAQINSQDRKVKAFGAKMVKDHGEGSETLKKLAASKNLTIPAEISNDQQKGKANLQKKKGSAFDKAYVSMMVDDHNKVIREFEKEAKNAMDKDIKTFAGDNLPMLYRHLDSAENLQKMITKKYEKEMPNLLPAPPIQ